MQNLFQDIRVALLKDSANDLSKLDEKIAVLISAAEFKITPGTSIILKPNLLSAQALATTDPNFVVSCCKAFLDLGAKVKVTDSPGFGTPKGVAAKIGLTRLLQPLGLQVEPLGKLVWRDLPLPSSHARLPIAKVALEADAIVSLPRVKVHRQMLFTGAVKNCFGLVGGLHKAVAHTLYGKDRAFFADVLAALWASLPQVLAIADGRIAMHVTGPMGGQPYPLELLGASRSAVALDEVICNILHLKFSEVPLGQALEKRGAEGASQVGYSHVFPLLTPSAFSAQGFRYPTTLTTASFAPHRLLISCCKRLFRSIAQSF